MRMQSGPGSNRQEAYDDAPRPKHNKNGAKKSKPKQSFFEKYGPMFMVDDDGDDCKIENKVNNSLETELLTSSLNENKNNEKNNNEINNKEQIINEENVNKKNRYSTTEDLEYYESIKTNPMELFKDVTLEKFKHWEKKISSQINYEHYMSNDVEILTDSYILDICSKEKGCE